MANMQAIQFFTRRKGKQMDGWKRCDGVHLLGCQPFITARLFFKQSIFCYRLHFLHQQLLCHSLVLSFCYGANLLNPKPYPARAGLNPKEPHPALAISHQLSA